MTDFVGLAMGLFRGPVALDLAGGDTEEPEPEPDPLTGFSRPGGDVLMAMGPTTAAGLTSSCEVC